MLRNIHSFFGEYQLEINEKISISLFTVLNAFLRRTKESLKRKSLNSLNTLNNLTILNDLKSIAPDK